MNAPYKLNVQGDVSDCLAGMQVLASHFNYELSPVGFTVYVKQQHGSSITVRKNPTEACIVYAEKAHFFRAWGLFLEALTQTDSEELIIEEQPRFTTVGAMFDVSQGNAVPQVGTVKNILMRMAVMGFNMLMLYMEDNYVLPNHPYFGYARSKYTFAELKECDDFAALFGIEMIPCMQTLAHLSNVLQWPPYADMRESESTLLVGSDKAYEFIEQMIITASAPFRSKRIHIGMDEAWRLGLGTSLQLNGLRSKFDLMNEHLARVLAIVDKHGLQPMIWSDMYFRAASKSGRYYDLAADIPPDVVAAMPKNVQLVYWDYDHEDPAFYREYIKRHHRFGSMPIFAGCIWSWISFTVNWGKTLATTNAALAACKSEGVREVIATLWGGYGTECNIYTALLGLQLYAEHSYASYLDMEKLQRRFAFCTGANYADFVNTTYLDEVPGIPPGNLECRNPSKFLLWQDLLTGLFDIHVGDLPLAQHYTQLTTTLAAGEQRNGEYGLVFGFLSRLSSVLALKSDLGVKILQAYQSGNRSELRHLVNDTLPELSRRVEDLQQCHREQWLTLYKALGWEIMDMRYGALLARIESARWQINEYLCGNSAHIAEFEEQRHYFNGQPGLGISCILQDRITSPSKR